ncbi:MAG: hypothetical protein ACC644_03565 [Candidatus Hydrothermarchaeales archaeon]
MLCTETTTWGCSSCFNHTHDEGTGYCAIVKRKIEKLRICPVDNLIYFTNL